MPQLIDTLAGSVLTAAMLLASADVARAAAGAPLSVAQQNDLVRTYCGACHDDARMVGGLSLEHFDAAHPDPTIAAMLLSKITNGLTLETVKAADTRAEAVALLEKELRSSAIYAAGIEPPDTATVRAWVSALSDQATGATEWTVHRNERGVPTASIVREVRVSSDPAKADIYRLAIACQPETREGDIKLTWAPGDLTNGREVAASADGRASVTRRLAVTTWKGNRGPTRGIGSIVLYSTRKAGTALTALPANTLAVTNLMSDQTVSVSFAELAASVRQRLSVCFSGTGAAD